jgi:tetratricopeptide (TPR) repeat protein
MRAYPLAELRYRQGRYAQARALFDDADVVPLSPAHAAWRATKRALEARLLVREGHPGKAERAAQAAVALLTQSDFLNNKADAHAALAEVRLLAGRADEAVEPAIEALALYEQKGNAAAAKRARALLDDPSVETTLCRPQPPEGDG